MCCKVFSGAICLMSSKRDITLQLRSLEDDPDMMEDNLHMMEDDLDNLSSSPAYAGHPVSFSIHYQAF